MIPSSARREPLVLMITVLVIMVMLGVKPQADRLTWLLETFPVMVVVPLLALTFARFSLTPLAYRLIALHAVILMVGGYYTYACVPLGDWVRDAFGLARNHYDRLGHFAQGFVPAIVAREILLRRTPLRRGGWLAVLVVSLCLAISAVYELIEWWAAVAGGAKADAFLGSQGDVWDTQWDMFMACVGAISSLALLSRVHDRQLSAWGLLPDGREPGASAPNATS
jgi:putative membrane protein